MPPSPPIRPLAGCAARAGRGQGGDGAARGRERAATTTEEPEHASSDVEPLLRLATGDLPIHLREIGAALRCQAANAADLDADGEQDMMMGDNTGARDQLAAGRRALQYFTPKWKARFVAAEASAAMALGDPAAARAIGQLSWEILRGLVALGLQELIDQHLGLGAHVGSSAAGAGTGRDGSGGGISSRCALSRRRRRHGRQASDGAVGSPRLQSLPMRANELSKICGP